MTDCIHAAGVTRKSGDCVFCEIERLKKELADAREARLAEVRNCIGAVAQARREALEEFCGYMDENLNLYDGAMVPLEEIIKIIDHYRRLSGDGKGESDD